MLNKLNTKERNIVFIVAVILSFLLFITFLQGYYSFDTHRLIKNGYTYYTTEDASFKDARLIMGWICLLADAINISYIPFYQIMLVIALLISCACVVEIYKIVNHYKPLTKRINKIFVFLVAFAFIFSTFYVNSMEFVENAVMALSIYMFMKAAEYIVIGNKYIEGLLFTIIGMFSYQGTIPMYVSLIVLITILENKRLNKNAIKQMGISAIILFISILLNEIFIYLYSPEGNKRAGNENMFIYFYENMCNLYRLVLYSIDAFPHYLWVSIILVLILIIIFYCKKEKNVGPLIHTLILIFFTFLGQFLIFVTQENFFIEEGRIFLAIGALISTILIYLYIKTKIFDKNNIYRNLLFFVFAIYFIVTIVESIYLQNLYKQGMEIDYKLSKAIEQITQENENVNKICFYYRKSTSDVKLELNPSIIRRSDLALGVYGSSTYKRDTGKEIFYNLDVKEEEYKKYFENQSEPVELKVVGDTIYIGVLL